MLQVKKKIGLCTPSERQGHFRVHSKGYYIQGHEHENKTSELSLIQLQCF